jgi:CRISPR/Cas system Type II protein with McrA/HNH and RuvC-like nuclease domain
MEYLTINYPIVDGWLNWHWASYLQSRNPNAPSIVSKLTFPVERQSLDKQTAYWKRVMDNEEITCIYSGAVLNGRSFSLDHFIPWSFVCHDQLWNLVPVLPSENSSKLNSLPHQKYLELFVANQYKGLAASSKAMNEREWMKFTEPFVADLRMKNVELLDKEKLEKSYSNIMGSLLALARQSGFEEGWISQRDKK